MSVLASAPGKLVLLGEYAVLEGAPALVVATRERARARIEPLPEGPSRLQARPLLDRAIEFDRATDGSLRWQTDLSEPERERLAWPGALLAALAARDWWPAGPLAVELDSREFHAADGSKLGLGSSAAITVALAGAARAAVDGPGGTPSLADLVALHRALQGGHGSGLDVAASLVGGTVRYQLDRDRPRAERVELPPGLALLALASGTSVSTPAALDRLRDWAAARPDDWVRLRAALATAAEAGVAALAEGPEAFAQALDGFAVELAELERLTGLVVYGDAHAPLVRLAAACGVAYKPSGAGGDLGIAASPAAERIAELRRRAAAADIRWLELDGRAEGLQVRCCAPEQVSA